MAYVRRRIVEMDGVQVPVSPLTVAQAEEFLKMQTDLLASETFSKSSPSEKASILKSKLWYPFTVQGLNNAAALDTARNSTEPAFTVDSLKKELDEVLIEKLKTTIMEMTGIVTAPVGEVKAP